MTGEIPAARSYHGVTRHHSPPVQQMSSVCLHLSLSLMFPRTSATYIAVGLLQSTIDLSLPLSILLPMVTCNFIEAEGHFE